MNSQRLTQSFFLILTILPVTLRAEVAYCPAESSFYSAKFCRNVAGYYQALVTTEGKTVWMRFVAEGGGWYFLTDLEGKQKPTPVAPEALTNFSARPCNSLAHGFRFTGQDGYSYQCQDGKIVNLGVAQPAINASIRTANLPGYPYGYKVNGTYVEPRLADPHWRRNHSNYVPSWMQTQKEADDEEYRSRVNQ